MITPESLFDLLEDGCNKCDAVGTRYSPAWADWYRQVEVLVEAGADREAAMESIPEPEGPEEYDCPECKGAGTVPTDLGQALLRFLQRHHRQSDGAR